MKTALTIAGSDSGGGAGIQADIKTFCAYGVYGMSVLTAVTAQNSTEVLSVTTLSPHIIRLQCQAVFEDFPVHAVKIGMTGNKESMTAIAEALEKYAPPFVVLDPVMVSKSGAALFDPQAKDVLLNALFPLASLITPNIPEAEALTGLSLNSPEKREKAAYVLLESGAQAVLLKGGHLSENDLCQDLFINRQMKKVFSTPRIPTAHTHGTGCTLSSAIAAGLALGWPLPLSVSRAKAFVTEAIRKAPGLGKGAGPLDHHISPFSLASREEQDDECF